MAPPADITPPSRLRLPYPAYLRALVRRSILLWALLRTALLFLGDGTLSVAASLVVVGGVALLSWVEARRGRESLFHANLGASPAWPAAIGALMAIVCEGLVGFLLWRF